MTQIRTAPKVAPSMTPIRASLLSLKVIFWDELVAVALSIVTADDDDVLELGPASVELLPIQYPVGFVLCDEGAVGGALLVRDDEEVR